MPKTIDISAEELEFTYEGKTFLSGRAIDLYSVIGTAVESTDGCSSQERYQKMATALCEEYGVDPEILTWQVVVPIFHAVTKEFEKEKKD